MRARLREGNARLQRLWERLHKARLWQRPFWAWLAWALGSLLADGLVYWSGQRWGLAATTDGLTYLILARNWYRFGVIGFARPEGGWQIITLWPPGYPLALAAVLGLGWQPVERAAWVLNLVLVSALLALVARAVFAVTRHAWPTLALTVALAVAYPLLHIYAWVRAETLFLVQLLLAGWALAAWQEHPSARKAVLVGLLAAWAVTVRWVAVAFVPWAAWVAWAEHHRIVPAERRRQAIAFALAAGLPIAGLFLATRVASGAMAQRRVAWHPPSPANWWRLVETLAGWVTLPFRHLSPASTVGRAAALVLLATGVVVLAYRRGQMSTEPRVRAWRWLARRWGLWIPVYFGVLVAAISLVAPFVWLKLRLLLPIFVPLVLLVGVAAWRLLSPRWWSAGLLLVVWLSWLRLAKAYDVFYARKWHNQGGGWRSEVVQTSPLWAAVRHLPEQVLLYSNQERVLAFYTDRPAHLLTGQPPMKHGQALDCDPITGRCRPLAGYTQPDQWAALLAQHLQGRCAAIVIVGDPTQEPRLEPTVADLRAHFPLVWQAPTAGLIFAAPAASCPLQPSSP